MNEPLYYLRTKDLGHYLNVVNLLGKNCELAPCRHDRDAVIYTEQQLEWAEKYYSKKKIKFYKQIVIRKERATRKKSK